MAEMKEVEVAPGRYLVGVNMGEGYDEYSDNMRMAIGFLRSNFMGVADRLINRLHVGLGIMMVPYDRYTVADPFVKIDQTNKEALVEAQELMERFETARLELAWLQGETDTVKLILGGQNG